jgi:hypothetical protein
MEVIIVVFNLTLAALLYFNSWTTYSKINEKPIAEIGYAPVVVLLCQLACASLLFSSAIVILLVPLKTACG